MAWCKHANTFVYVDTWDGRYQRAATFHTHMYICLHIFICFYMCVYVYIYIYILQEIHISGETFMYYVTLLFLQVLELTSYVVPSTVSILRHVFADVGTLKLSKTIETIEALPTIIPDLLKLLQL